MKKKRVVSLLFVLAALWWQPSAEAQTRPGAAAKAVVLIHAGRLVDVRAGRVVENQGILIEGERIKAVGPWNDLRTRAPSTSVIDLSGETVLPGLADCH